MSGDADYWNRIASRYEALYDKPWFRFEDDLTRSHLISLLRRCPGQRVLDIGCGAGLGYELLRTECPAVEYIGLDISNVMLQQAQKAHPKLRAFVGEGDQLRALFDAGQFDLIMSINVAASFPRSTTAMLEDCFELLTPGGWFYLSFLNRRSLRRTIKFRFAANERYRTRGDRSSPGFVWANTFSGEEIRELARNAGFTNISYGYRSVLGGVLESKYSIPLERLLQKMVPALGHELVITGRR